MEYQGSLACGIIVGYAIALVLVIIFVAVKRRKCCSSIRGGPGAGHAFIEGGRGINSSTAFPASHEFIPLMSSRDDVEQVKEIAAAIVVAEQRNHEEEFFEKDVVTNEARPLVDDPKRKSNVAIEGPSREKEADVQSSAEKLFNADFMVQQQNVESGVVEDPKVDSDIVLDPKVQVDIDVDPKVDTDIVVDPKLNLDVLVAPSENVDLAGELVNQSEFVDILKCESDAGKEPKVESSLVVPQETEPDAKKRQEETDIEVDGNVENVTEAPSAEDETELKMDSDTDDSKRLRRLTEHLDAILDEFSSVEHGDREPDTGDAAVREVLDNLVERVATSPNATNKVDSEAEDVCELAAQEALEQILIAVDEENERHLREFVKQFVAELVGQAIAATCVEQQGLDEPAREAV